LPPSSGSTIKRRKFSNASPFPLPLLSNPWPEDRRPGPITQVKQSEERDWPGGVSASMLQQSVRDLDKAFKSWWKSKGKVHTPRFKKRNNRQSIRIRGKEFHPTDRGGRFPKVGGLKLVRSRPLPALPSSVTIVKDCTGRYVASFVVEVERPQL